MTDGKFCLIDKECVHFNQNQQCQYALSCRDDYIRNLEISLFWSGKHDDMKISEFHEYLNKLKGLATAER